MIQDFLKTAIVIDNNDPDKKGKCKIRVLPEMNGVEESLLPWCKPFLSKGGGFTNSGEHNIPEMGEYVKAIIGDKFWKHIYYIPSDNIENGYPYKSFEDIKNNIQELGNQAYPQPKYINAFKDGSFYFHNSETGECGIYNKNGSYCIFDADGQIIIHAKNKNIVIDGGDSGKIVLKNGVTDLYSLLKDCISIIKNIITPSNLISASPGAPVVYSQVSTDLPTIIQVANLLDQLME